MESIGIATNKDMQKYLELKSTSVIIYLKGILKLIEKIREGRNISYKIKISK